MDEEDDIDEDEEMDEMMDDGPGIGSVWIRQAVEEDQNCSSDCL